MIDRKPALVRKSLYLVVGSLLAAFALQACNNSVEVVDPDPQPAPTRTKDSLPVYALKGDIYLPDGARWILGKDTGAAEYVVVKKAVNDSQSIVAAKFDTKNLLQSDTLKVQYTKFGMVIQTYLYTKNTTVEGGYPRYLTKIPDNTTVALLQSLATLNAANPSLYPLSKDGVVKAYANLLLSGSASLPSLDSLPKGLAKDSIRKAIVQIAVVQQVRSASLVANAKLQLTQIEIRAYLQILITDKSIAPADTLKVFQPNSIVWDEEFGIDGATAVQKSKALKIKGLAHSPYAWNKDMSFQVLDDKNANVTSQFALTPPAMDSVKDTIRFARFSGLVQVIPVSASVGSYRLRLQITNTHPDTSVRDVAFAVEKDPTDTTTSAPQITRQRPSTADTTLSFGDSVVRFVWTVKDDSRFKINAALINGVEATPNDKGEYIKEVTLQPGQDFKATFKAKSTSGLEALDSVVARRSKDQEKPTITKMKWEIDTALNGAQTYQFDSSEVKVTLKWVIEDNFGFGDSAACIMNGAVVVKCVDVTWDPQNSRKGTVTYEHQVPNQNTMITLRVRDKAHNEQTAEVRFLRPPKAGDILAIWDDASFVWDAARVVWQ